MKLGDLCNPITYTSEAIAYQKGHPAGPELEALFHKFKKLVDDGATHALIESQLELKKEFSALLTKHFGIKASLVTNTLLAAVVPNVYTPHNPVIRKAAAEWYDTLRSGGISTLTNLPEVKSLGSVDFERAKISGWFSEQEVPIFINFKDLFLNEKSTVPEVVAITLHEIGHVFEAVSNSSRSNRVNMVMSDIVRHISSKKRESNVEYVYRELKSIDATLDRDIIEGLIKGNSVVMGVSAFRAAKGVIQNLSGSSLYSGVSFEAMADSFAVRMGYADHLATSLERLQGKYVGYHVVGEITKLVILFMTVSSLLAGLQRITAGALTIMTIAGIVSSVVTVISIINSSRLSKTDLEYDDNQDRIGRIRQDAINSLKQMNLSNKDKRLILEQIEIIDKAYRVSFNVPRPIQKLLTFIIASDSNAAKSIEAQQQFEKLIANDIFVAANKLALKA